MDDGLPQQSFEVKHYLVRANQALRFHRRWEPTVRVKGLALLRNI